jgi:hypothetical protein
MPNPISAYPLQNPNPTKTLTKPPRKQTKRKGENRRTAVFNYQSLHIGCREMQRAATNVKTKTIKSVYG